MIQPSSDEIRLTRKAASLYFVVIFIGYTFAFLAAANEIRDVLGIYFQVTISPRAALVLISLLQMMGWASWGIYKQKKDKGLLPILYSTFILFVFYLGAESELGNDMLGTSLPLFQTVNTVLIIVNIIVAAGYASFLGYSAAVHPKHT